MRPRQPVPRLWLMTDERQGDALWTALRRLPRGAGVVFRHYSLKSGERRRLFERVKRLARARGHLLLLGGTPRLARAWGADGAHGRGAGGAGACVRTIPVHDAGEIARARRLRPYAVFLSPLWPTRSHPGTPALGPLRFALLARPVAVPVLALGGIIHRRARHLPPGAYGWAAIDAWSGSGHRGQA